MSVSLTYTLVRLFVLHRRFSPRGFSPEESGRRFFSLTHPASRMPGDVFADNIRYRGISGNSNSSVRRISHSNRTRRQTKGLDVTSKGSQAAMPRTSWNRRRRVLYPHVGYCKYILFGLSLIYIIHVYNSQKPITTSDILIRINVHECGQQYKQPCSI